MGENSEPVIRRLQSAAVFDGFKKFLFSRSGKISVGSLLGVVILCLLIFGPDGDGNSESSGFKAGTTGLTGPASLPMTTFLPEYLDDGLGVRSDKTTFRPRPVRTPKLTGPQLVPRILRLNLPEGALAEAELVTGAKTGPVKARLLTDLKSQFGERLLPLGSVLIGSAQASGDRLNIQFSKSVLPDGDLLKVSALALDSGDKTPGIKGSFITKQGLLLAGSVALNTLGGVAEGLQENEAMGAGVVRKSNLRNATLNGASRATLDQARELTQSFRENSKDIAVSAGTKIFVFFGDSNEGGGP